MYNSSNIVTGRKLRIFTSSRVFGPPVEGKPLDFLQGLWCWKIFLCDCIVTHATLIPAGDIWVYMETELWDLRPTSEILPSSWGV